MKQYVIVLVVMIACGGSLWAQGKGAGGGQRGAGGPGNGRGGAQMGGSQMSGGNGAGLQQQDRTRIRATDQQRDRYRDCTQATQQLRKRLRTLSRQGKGAALGSVDAARYREQIRNEYQATLQEREQWMASLSDEQELATQGQVRELEQRSSRLTETLNALDLALAAEEIDSGRVRELASNADSQLQAVQHQQNELAERAGIQP